ncbi:MAG: hypothetical protein ABEL76_12535, partial [Bradymonadaceae bacterium]
MIRQTCTTLFAASVLVAVSTFALGCSNDAGTRNRLKGTWRLDADAGGTRLDGTTDRDGSTADTPP